MAGKPLRDLLLLLAVGFLAGYGATSLAVPAAWMLGPMIAAGLLANVTPARPRFPRQLVPWAHGILAISTGLSFTPNTLRLLGSNLGPVLLVAGLTLVVSLANGLLLARVGGIDRASSVLGSFPAMAAGMVAMSRDMGADSRLVALIQYWRVVLVVLIAPIVLTHLPIVQESVSGIAPVLNGAAVAGLSPGLPLPASLAVALVTGAAGLWLGRRLRLPAPTFMGPMLLTLLISGTGLVPFFLPRALVSAGLVMLGLSTGSSFDLRAMANLGKVAVVAAAEVLLLIVTCGGLGYLLHLLTGLSPATTLLGTTPGGWEAMLATSFQLGADTPMIMSLQFLRSITIALIGPYLIRLLRLAPSARVPALERSAYD